MKTSEYRCIDKYLILDEEQKIKVRGRIDKIDKEHAIKVKEMAEEFKRKVKEVRKTRKSKGE